MAPGRPVRRRNRDLLGDKLKARLLAVSGATIVLAIGAFAAPARASETGAPSRSGSPERAATLPARWAAGPVALGSGYGHGGSQRVRQVQRALRELRYRPGPVDGLFGPLTERAVLRFQRAEGLQPDGIIGPRTLGRMRALIGQPPTTATPIPDAARSPERRPIPAMPQGQPAPAPRDVPAGNASPGGIPYLPLLLLLAALVGFLVTMDVSTSRRHGPRAARQAPPSEAAVPSIGPLAPPAPVAGGDWGDGNGGAGPRIGEVLRDAGELSAPDLVAALREQARSGGRLGEILVASGTVPVAALTAALARQLGMDTLRGSDEPIALLTADDAQAWRAVALAGSANAHGEVAVAIADPTDGVVAKLEARLERPVHLRLCDEETLDALLNCVYADADADEVTRALRETAPELSAFRTRLSRPQTVAGFVLGFLLVLGVLTDLQLTATVLVALATAFFVLSTGFRLWAARQGFRPGATIDPPLAELAAIDERTLPTYTVLLPLYKEKAGTVRALFDALSRMDYPKHKLDALLLIEADDDQTRAAIERVGRPAWMRVLPLPPGTPRTKPRAMGIGLRYAKGTLVAVYDAEDKPDPAQLKKAAWGFERVDSSVACLQAKLGYYNPRQNLLTRWFTLEYDAWFNIFLPGLHRIGAPIPLGGTSNHFRREALEECLGWDPYNVTEDADLGLRFARLGLTTVMLESTTGEEANSQVPNWLRQRSRWSKGYMQTVLVHTRRPWALLRDLGPKATAGFLLTIGGTFVTALLAPVFWALLLLWCFFQPDWIAALFPGPIYYAASICLVAGNFALVFLSLGAAVGRGHDDLAPHALLTPCYWVLMSAATYLALFELFFRPYHWHKTEHGLHLAEEAA
jgi:cellulose synthase/poly-beta-1,6-N-acetylglucosamine synthase-like glycosyltransferase/peptidoglycan hydrolase-like protein with peptidoglycan-binding domain